MNTDRPLTERQMHILRLVAEGQTNDEIATALDIAKSTVANTLIMIFARIGVDNRVSAAMWFRDHCEAVR